MFFRGTDQVGDVIDTPSTDAVLSTTPQTNSTTKEPSSSSQTSTEPESSPQATPTNDQSNNNDSVDNVSTSDWIVYTNKLERYEVKIHPWWWWSRYNDVNGALSIVAFDTNSLDGRSHLDAKITITTYTSSGKDGNANSVIKRTNNQEVVIDHGILTSAELEIFNTMVESFKFID